MDVCTWYETRQILVRTHPHQFAPYTCLIFIHVDQQPMAPLISLTWHVSVTGLVRPGCSSCGYFEPDDGRFFFIFIPSKLMMALKRPFCLIFRLKFGEKLSTILGLSGIYTRFTHDSYRRENPNYLFFSRMYRRRRHLVGDHTECASSVGTRSCHQHVARRIS